MNVTEALAGRFRTIGEPVLSFGIATPPTWLKFSVHNPGGQAQQSAGDRQPFSQRTPAARYPAFDYSYPPGDTIVLLRVESIDPMSLPVYFLSPEAAADRALSQAYSYGLLYGAILLLLACYLIFFSVTKDPRHLNFSLYIGAFLLANVAYTGRGFMYFWPESIYWQQFSIPLLMTAFNVCGFAFALRFLNVPVAFPRTNRFIISMCFLFIVLQLASLLWGSSTCHCCWHSA